MPVERMSEWTKQTNAINTVHNISKWWSNRNGMEWIQTRSANKKNSPKINFSSARIHTKMNFLFKRTRSISKTSVTFFNYWNAVVHFSFIATQWWFTVREIYANTAIWCFYNAWYFEPTSFVPSSDHPMIKMFQNYRFEMLLICVFITHHVYCFFFLSSWKDQSVCDRVCFFRILIKKFVNAMASFRYTRKKIKRQSKTIDVISISFLRFNHFFIMIRLRQMNRTNEAAEKKEKRKRFRRHRWQTENQIFNNLTGQSK